MKKLRQLVQGVNDLTLGWVGGLRKTFPMFALGDEMHREGATKSNQDITLK